MTRINLTHELPAATMARLKELFDVTIGPARDAKGTSVLVPNLTDTVDAATIDALGPDLKLIANFGAGVDHIDVAHAKSKGITVTNTPSVLTEDTADVAMALILAVPRRLSEAAQAIRQQTWKGWSPNYLLGHRVNGKALGIVGMGHIGQAVARRARGFGLAIHYHQRHQLHGDVEKEFGATYWPSLEAMLSNVDIVTLHCPHTPQTHHLMGVGQLRQMKPTSYLINTARGALVHEQALIDALNDGVIAGAGLDVFEHAPAVPDGLRALPNVVLLPHISSATIESRMEMGERVIINIKTFVDGHQPPNRVLVD
jgi:glyoxylate reductase